MVQRLTPRNMHPRDGGGSSPPNPLPVSEVRHAAGNDMAGRIHCLPPWWHGRFPRSSSSLSSVGPQRGPQKTWTLQKGRVGASEREIGKEGRRARERAARRSWGSSTGGWQNRGSRCPPWGRAHGLRGPWDPLCQVRGPLWARRASFPSRKGTGGSVLQTCTHQSSLCTNTHGRWETRLGAQAWARPYSPPESERVSEREGVRERDADSK